MKISLDGPGMLFVPHGRTYIDPASSQSVTKHSDIVEPVSYDGGMRKQIVHDAAKKVMMMILTLFFSSSGHLVK